MPIGITVAGSVVIGSGIGIPLDNISASSAPGPSQTQTFTTGVAQSFPTIVVSYGYNPITYSLDPFSAELPTGLTFHPSNGYITGTATTTTNGAVLFVNASDLYNRTTGNVIMLVVEAGFDTILAISSRTVTAGINETGFVPVTTTGGTAPITFSISPVVTSLGLSFNTSNGAISGNATSTIAATSYRITATDAISQSSFKDFTMTVAAPAFAATQSIASRTLTTGTADSFTPVTVTTGSTGYGTKTWALTSSPALPSGLSLNSTNGLISGTPTINRASTSYTIRITDGLGQTASQSFNMTVNAPALTTVLSISSRNLQVGTADSFTPVTLGSTGYGSKTWSISPSLPGGLTLTTSNGLISGTPTTITASTSYTVTVTDGLGQTSNKSFTMDIVSAVYTAGYAVSNPYAGDLNPNKYIDTNYTLYSWGNNSNGQLGNNTTVNRSGPVQISASWVFISEGESNFSLGIKSNGTLWSWGVNTSGQLAIGNTQNRSSPTQIGSATNWLSASVYPNGQSSGAINTLGQLWVAGDNTFGELGDNTTINRSSLVQVSGSWTMIRMGNSTVGIDSNYNLYGWGQNTYGQVGDGTTINRSSPVILDGVNRYVNAYVADVHKIAMREDFTLWSWGRNNTGQLGLGDTNNRSRLVQIGLSSWYMASVHEGGGVAIKNDSTLWTWGLNTGGQLGDSTTANKSSPIQVGSLGWKSITEYHNTTMHAVDQLDNIYGWGTNTNGDIGDGTTVAKSSPVLVTLGTLIPTSTGQILSVAGPQMTKFIKTQNNDFSLWGMGMLASVNFGAIADAQSSTINRSIPTQISSGLLDQWYAIASFGYSNLAIKTDGTLWGWGINTNGTLGDGTTLTRSSPVQIGSNSNWTFVAGDFTTNGAAVNSLGQLYVWGTNTRNQLGFVGGSRSSPTLIPGSTSWIAVAVNAEAIAAISTTNKLYTWGLGTSGNYLGDGTTVNRSNPVQLGNSSWTQVGGISSGFYALRADKTLWSWGNGSAGSLGVGDNLTRSSPTQVAGGGSWNFISTNGGTLAIKTNGLLFAWGLNASGQLGLNDTISRSSPTQVSATISWINVNSNDNTAIGLTTTNQIYTWGLNRGTVGVGGGLGDGTTINRSSPTLVHSGNTPSVEYLLVGGGGGGGGTTLYSGGGGGAGGYIEGINYPISYNQTITITLGEGGAGGTNAGTQGSNGENTTMSSTTGGTITAYGGGGGGVYNPSGGTSGSNGGSGGGGGSGNTPATAGGVGVYVGSTYVDAARQGFDGGKGATDYNGGGGGGAGGAGGNATPDIKGTAGPGRTWRDGVTYAGGGGSSDLDGGAGGGGAGQGLNDIFAPATAGTPNTGGGGGAGGYFDGNAAAGGKGIAIIRYPSVYPVASATTGSPTVTTVNGYRYYKFTSSGTIKF